jgi:hypothetical protein
MARRDAGRAAAITLALVACGGSAPAPVAPVAAVAPPPPTFRWSLDPLDCAGGRSSMEVCRGGEAFEPYTLAAYVPVEVRDPRVTVIRYDGPHAGGPLRWQRHVELGTAPRSTVIAGVAETAVVAAVSDGAVTVATLDGEHARVIGRVRIVERGGLAVQLEEIDDHARVHVRTQTGGVVAVIEPWTARFVAHRAVPARAIVEDLADSEALDTRGARVDDVTLGWESGRLVLRRAPIWMHVLRASSRFRGHIARMGLLHAGSNLVVMMHDIDRSRVDATAFDRATGRRLWQTRISIASRDPFGHMFAGSLFVRAGITGEQLVVVGQTRDRQFACTVGLADGVERACVDRDLDAQPTTIDFGDVPIATP